MGEATCSTPAVANSVSGVKDVSVNQVGDKLSFTCGQGFQLDGAQHITCGPDGQWQPPPPRCLPSPVQTQLPDKESELVFQLFFFFTSQFIKEVVKTFVTFLSVPQVDVECRWLRATPTPTLLTSTSRWRLLPLMPKSTMCVTLDTSTQAAADLAFVERGRGRRST